MGLRGFFKTFADYNKWAFLSVVLHPHRASFFMHRCLTTEFFGTFCFVSRYHNYIWVRRLIFLGSHRHGGAMTFLFGLTTIKKP